MNRDIITHEANGLLASSTDDWVKGLARFITDQALRRRSGAAARQTVQARYALSVNAPKFVRAVSALWSAPAPVADAPGNRETSPHVTCAESAAS
jgi:hypothetical protein